MVQAGYGRIVNITSVIGQIGNFGQANYAASKSGAMALTKTLAKELAAKGIRECRGARVHRDGQGGRPAPAGPRTDPVPDSPPGVRSPRGSGPRRPLPRVARCALHHGPRD